MQQHIEDQASSGKTCPVKKKKKKNIELKDTALPENDCKTMKSWGYYRPRLRFIEFYKETTIAMQNKTKKTCPSQHFT